jgi:hypothetical protein
MDIHATESFHRLPRLFRWLAKLMPGDVSLQSGDNVQEKEQAYHQEAIERREEGS